MRAAREAIEPLLEAGVDFRLAWVFIDMMQSDTGKSTADAAARIFDPRVMVFRDSNHLLGQAMARRLGWKHHVAWDTYFIYNPRATWSDAELPHPDEWFHQLKDREVWEKTAGSELGTTEWTQALAEKSEADPARFRTGGDLRVALETSLKYAAAQPLPAHYLTST